MSCTRSPKAKVIQSRVRKQNNCPSFGNKNTPVVSHTDGRGIHLNMDCGPRTVDLGLRNVDRGLRTADCGLRNVDCGLRTVDCRLRTADCGLQTADCGLNTNTD